MHLPHYLSRVLSTPGLCKHPQLFPATLSLCNLSKCSSLSKAHRLCGFLQEITFSPPQPQLLCNSYYYEAFNITSSLQFRILPYFMTETDFSIFVFPVAPTIASLHSRH